MTSQSTPSVKIKVTASLNPALVEQIDQYVKETNAGSRSQLIEYALGKWCEEQKKQKIENEIEAYYLSLTDEERQEDRQWNRVAAESAGPLWQD